MLKFIQIQYLLGKLTAVQVHAFVPRYLTETQCAEVLKER